MIIYSSLFLIAAISGPVCVDAVELEKADDPIDGKFIVTTAPGVITEGGGEIRSPQADKILQIIAGPDGDNIIAQSHDGDDIGTQYHGEVEQVYRSVMEGFAATLDRVGLQNVLNSPDVVGVEQDGYVELDQVRSWDLDRIDDENLPPDQSSNPTFGNSGQGVTAYVIDTGILASHVEFEGRATQEFDSTGGSNADCHGHGTHVAGTVGAKTYGVANKVKLVGVKVLSCSGKGSLSGFIAGIDWVKANAKKPATANISLGGIRSIAVNTSIKNLVTSGVTTVVVAGNNSGDMCQKSTKSELSAITVASATQANTRSSFSNWDKCVDVFAPGSGIKSPWIGSNTATKIISGTSMASPHVCGTVALYLGQDSNLSPTVVALKIRADSNSKKILNSRSGTSNRMLVVGGSGEKQFTSSSEVQGQVRIYCQDPENYDTTEYGPMQNWDVSQVTSMYQVFSMYYNGQTNECDIPDISGWDVSQVTDFSWMFFYAKSFNQNIGNWDVSKGITFYYMFYYATSFNQNIGN